MGLRLFLLLFFAMISSEMLAIDTTYFDELKHITNLQEDEHLVVMYQTTAACVKCHIKPMHILDSLQNTGVIKKYKLIALVACSRDIELEIFKKQYLWDDYILRDDGTARKKLDADILGSISVLTFSGQLITSE